MSAPIEFAQGDTVNLTITVNDGQGSPLDISSDTFEAKVKDIADLATSLGDFTWALTTDGLDGKVTLTLTTAVTLGITSNVEYNAKGVKSATPSAVYFYDVYRTKPDTTKRRIADGLVTVEPTISLTAT